MESVVWSVDAIERNQVKAGLGGGRLPGSLLAVFCHGAVQYLSTWRLSYLETDSITVASMQFEICQP